MIWSLLNVFGQIYRNKVLYDCNILLEKYGMIVWGNICNIDRTKWDTNISQEQVY